MFHRISSVEDVKNALYDFKYNDSYEYNGIINRNDYLCLNFDIEITDKKLYTKLFNICDDVYDTDDADVYSFSIVINDENAKYIF